MKARLANSTPTFSHLKLALQICLLTIFLKSVITYTTTFERTPLTMTVKELKQILNNVPEDAILLVTGTDYEVTDVENISVEYHSDGRVRVIFSDEG